MTKNVKKYTLYNMIMKNCRKMILTGFATGDFFALKTNRTKSAEDSNAHDNYMHKTITLILH